MSGSDPRIRQKDIVPPDKVSACDVTIIGAGAVGAFTALCLAKTGVGRMSVYDFDVVSTENLGPQWYRERDLGSPKVEALREIVRDFTGLEIVANNRRFIAPPVSGLVVSAVDSMDTRISIWRHLRKMPAVHFYVDARMAAEVGKVYAVDMRSGVDVGAYEAELYPSSEALQEPCTARATAYCAMGLASFVTATVVNFLTGRPYKRLVTVDFRNGLII